MWVTSFFFILDSNWLTSKPSVNWILNAKSGWYPDFILVTPAPGWQLPGLPFTTKLYLPLMQSKWTGVHDEPRGTSVAISRQPSKRIMVFDMRCGNRVSFPIGDERMWATYLLDYTWKVSLLEGNRLMASICHLWWTAYKLGFTWKGCELLTQHFLPTTNG